MPETIAKKYLTFKNWERMTKHQSFSTEAAGKSIIFGGY
jgi:hypothetical protein